MASKPQISVEATREFAAEFALFADGQRTKKRYLVEDALRNYIAEVRGSRLSVDIGDADLKLRLDRASKNDGFRLEWLVQKALDEFFKAREIGTGDKAVVDLSPLTRTKVDAFREVRGGAETQALLEDAIGQMIERELRYDDEARTRYENLLGQFRSEETN